MLQPYRQGWMGKPQRVRSERVYPAIRLARTPTRPDSWHKASRYKDVASGFTPRSELARKSDPARLLA